MPEWDLPAPHTVDVVVEATDIDGLQHTNNAVYVKWCERVAWAHSESLGLDLECYRPAAGGFEDSLLP